MKSLYRILNFSRYTIYVIIVMAILVPLLSPIGIPIKIGREARNFYEIIGRTQPGEVLLLDVHFALAAAVECMPQVTAIASQAFDQGLKIILVSMNPEGEPFAMQALQELGKAGARYGEDVVYLGFVPGDELAIVSMLSDLHKTVPQDYKGTRLSDLPLTAKVKSGAEIAISVPVTSDASAPEYWTRQVKPYPSMKLLMASQASLWPKIQPYLATGQIKGALNGARGAAEYELLLNKKGAAVASMDATSVAYLTFIVLVIIGNIVHWIEPRAKEKEGIK
ncbi:MAG TPA: hypothetical protein GXX30_01025 [Firmicutes bacterium]|nr:hypothetical protein [Candidatus Fermentithermobacillaceae bacterium]